jgi:hypothetical protein
MFLLETVMDEKHVPHRRTASEVTSKKASSN